MQENCLQIQAWNNSNHIQKLNSPDLARNYQKSNLAELNDINGTRILVIKALSNYSL